MENIQHIQTLNGAKNQFEREMIMIPYFVSKVEIHLYCLYTILSLVWIQV